jgi:prolyl-tRNA synthetase
MKADTGPIGGDLSHEFIILAETGESQVFCDQDWLALDVLDKAPKSAEELQSFVDWATGFYAATEEKHDAAACPVPTERLHSARGIEVGHIFYFGEKYSKPMNATVTQADGSVAPLHMGSYGVGVSRLLGAIIEASHDEAGIIWPEAVAPYHVGIITMKAGDAASDAKAMEIYDALTAKGIDVLYDDRDERAGVKFADMDLIGLPWQLIIGPRGLEKGVVELKNRRTGQRDELSVADALARLGA